MDGTEQFRPDQPSWHPNNILGYFSQAQWPSRYPDAAFGASWGSITRDAGHRLYSRMDAVRRLCVVCPYVSVCLLGGGMRTETSPAPLDTC